jgi:hypothetical protein
MQNTNIRQNLDFIIALIISIGAFIFVIWWNIENPHITVKYDCSIAEISPDYPIQVKEACRKLRAENILQKPK